MNKALKYSLGGFLLAAFAAGFAAVSMLSCSQKSILTCDSIKVSFSDSLRFLTSEDVEECIKKEYGICVGQKRDSIKLARIEDILKSNSSVRNCEAWISHDGTLHVEISQRTPCVMFKKGEVRFYADKEGYIFPLHGKTVAVPVVEGNLPLSEGGAFRGYAITEEERVWIAGVLDMLDYVKSERKWRGKVTEFHAESNGDISLKTNIGEERIIIGYPESFEQQFKKIEKYYGWIVPAKGEGYYKSVNLKYNKQIICRKDI